MPRHINPPPNSEASAPYNFVPLPEEIFEVEDGVDVLSHKCKPWEMHDQFVPGTHTGWIDLEIETLTRLFIRGPVMMDAGGKWDSRDARLRPDPYLAPDGRPAIPGSSLRGMIRTLIEIISFSKIQPVSNAKPFYRSVSDDRIGQEYRSRMTTSGQKPGGGILRMQGGRPVIEPRDYVRVSKTMLANTHNGGIPSWTYQHRAYWVRTQDGDEATDIQPSGEMPAGQDWQKGVLVLSGYMSNKKREFVFLEPNGETPDGIRVPPNVLRRFHDEDQITQWQQKAFPRNEPTQACRPTDGLIRDGEPVFFLTDRSEKSDDNPDGLVFFGRAGMFRLPYDLSPSDLIPEELKSGRLDLAEAMFGKVGTDGAIKGRVFFEDVVAREEQECVIEEMIVPRILSSPKPTSFQLYLTQNGQTGKNGLTTFLKGDYTVIRGHKLYWHRATGDGSDLIKEPNRHSELLADLQKLAISDRQHTIVRPVRAGITFKGRVRFENLADVELGALLCALDLPEGCHHKIGMAKPLGMGSVKVRATLYLADRNARYRSWGTASHVPQDGSGGRCRKVFEDAMISHAKASGEIIKPDCPGLRQIARLDALFYMLSWEQRPEARNTGSMRLAGYDSRLVLPTPHVVVDQKEPEWREDPPRPAQRPAPEQNRERSHHPQFNRGDATSSATHYPVTIPTSPRTKPVGKGQELNGTIVLHTEGYMAKFEGDERHAQITNIKKIIANIQDGATAEFYIEEESKKKGIKCRLLKLL